MSTIYLRFTDEAAFLAACAAAGIEPAPEITLPDSTSLSVIGTIYDVDTTDPVNPIYTPKAGYHVNILGVLPDDWDAYVIPPPLTPLRTY